MEKRNLVLIGRLLAAYFLITGRKRVRVAAWAAHDFLWLYPTLMRNCDWHGEVVTRFETSEREVWLTIDDGPDVSDTPDILAQLAAHEARATFFVIGKKADRHPELCRRIVDEGHSLGNHTYTHPAGRWWLYPRFLMRREIRRANQAILAATGTIPAYFRSPVGMNNLSVHPVTHAAGHRVIGWSAAGCDGCKGVPSAVARRIMRAVRPGSIILLHQSGMARRRVLALAHLLEELSAAGYRCVLPPAESLR